MAEALIHGGWRRLAIPQFFPDTLKNEDIGVHTHTDGQNHSRNPRQSQRHVHACDRGPTQEPEQDDQIQNQGHVRIDARPAVVDQHENQDRYHPDHGRSYAGADRICAEGRPHRALFQIGDTGRQSTRAENHRQIFRLLVAHAPAADFAAITNRFLDVRDFLHFVVEHHGKALVHVRRSEIIKTLAAFASKGEAHAGLTVLVTARLSVTQVLTCHR